MVNPGEYIFDFAVVIFGVRQRITAKQTWLTLPGSDRNHLRENPENVYQFNC